MGKYTIWYRDNLETLPDWFEKRFRIVGRSVKTAGSGLVGNGETPRGGKTDALEGPHEHGSKQEKLKGRSLIKGNRGLKVRSRGIVRDALGNFSGLAKEPTPLLGSGGKKMKMG